MVYCIRLHARQLMMMMVMVMVMDQYLRRSAGGGASLWSRSRSSSLPVDIAGGGGRRGDLSSVQGSGLGKLLT